MRSGGDGLHVAVLGPLRVERDGTPVRLGPRLVTLLAVLVLEEGRAVPAGRMVELLWGEPAPDRAPVTLRSHVSHLRRALEPHRVVVTVGSGAGAGYRLDLPAERVDARHFEQLYAQARRLLVAGEPDLTERAAVLLADALALLRGPAYADVADRPFALPEVARLEAVRRAARSDHAEALSSLGRHAEAAADLGRLVAEEPYDERARRMLALALYAQRRVDEAALVCREGLTLLHERGVDATALRELQRAILRGEAVVADATPAPKRIVPRLLPPDPPHFVGRVAEVERATRLLGSGAVLVTGPPGVGKTHLAIRLGHAVAGDFPDGQLYVNLRGFDPGGPAMSPAEAVRGFLEALEVPAARIPVTLAAQAGLYRSLLADRRALVVLDNARDPEQVRPLLPAARGCAVVVTSRDQLTGLVSVDGAHPIALEVMTAAESRQLLARRIDTARLAAEPEAVDPIVRACAGLPLALSIVAARAATRTRFTLASLAAELHDARDRLDALAGTDPAADVRALFSWSYHALDPDTARLFRLLGVHPGPEVGAPAAASLAGVPVREAGRMLADLARAHLVTEIAPGRFAFHDLLRLYAAELAGADPERAAATGRMYAHYTHTGYTAALLLDPQRDPLALDPLPDGVAPEPLADYAEAMAWFTAERAVLVAAIGQPHGEDRYRWRLAWMIANFLDRRGLWHELAAVQGAALDAARRAGEALGEAHAHRYLGHARIRLSREDEAGDNYRAAADRFLAFGDVVGEANVHLDLAQICERRGDHAAALDHIRRAQDLYRRAGHRARQALTLNSIGWFHAKLGEYREAIEPCEQALVLSREIGDRRVEAASWDSLGYARQHLGEHREAITSYGHAVTLYREAGDRFNEAEVLRHLSDSHVAAGDLDAARESMRHAVEILDELAHPDAAVARARLADLA